MADEGRCRGAALILTMLICIVLVSMVLTYGQSIRVENQASANYEASAQAMAVARGAVEAVLVMGDNVPVEAVEIGGGTYWIIRPNYEDETVHAFGLVDEGGKINLNAATRAMLVELPRMTDDMASAVIDWRGGTAEPPDEDEFGFGDADLLDDIGGGGWGYSEFGYQNKAEPFETVAELLLVRGFTPIVLFGEDANLNGVLDPNEDDGGVLDPPDRGDGRLHRGLWDSVTVWSRDPGTPTGAGSLAGDSEDGDDEGTGEALEEGERGVGNTLNANFARRSRLQRALTGVLGEERAAEVAVSIRSNRPYRNMIHLMQQTELEAEDMMLIERVISVSRRGRGGRGGRGGVLNVNTASPDALAALPSLGEAEADALVAFRESAGIHDVVSAMEVVGTDDIMGSIYWVAQVLAPEQAVRIGNLITTRSFVRSADIVAVSGDGRAFERVRVVVDFTDGEGRLVHWQRLTHLGWPLPREWQRQLREGEAVTELAGRRSGANTWR